LGAGASSTEGGGGEALSEEFVRHYLEESIDRLNSGRRALDQGRYSTSIFYSQECVEFAVKAVMETLSIKYPPIHDVSDLVLKLEKDTRMPGWFRRRARHVAEVVSGLAGRRILSRYGDQIRKIPPSKLFDKRDAEKAIADAEGIYGLSCKFVEWWFKEKEK
jgi:HEPN domain-containing protein